MRLGGRHGVASCGWQSLVDARTVRYHLCRFKALSAPLSSNDILHSRTVYIASPRAQFFFSICSFGCTNIALKVL